jgi:uncharacterized protein
VPGEQPARLCISLHDVAPATLADCRRVLDFLDSLHAGPVALLVVPDYHGRGRADRDSHFVSFVESRLRRGDEIVLHGLRHLDASPPGQGFRDWFERRIYTAGEGEFARLDAEAARAKLMRGLAILRAAGWQPRGFVAPAWLMSAGTLEALEDLPLEYCTTRTQVVVLRSGARIAAPSLAVSTRSPGRRAASLAWNMALLQHSGHQPVLRAALHPADLRYPSMRALWRRLLVPQISARRVVTEAGLLSRRAVPRAVPTPADSLPRAS